MKILIAGLVKAHQVVRLREEAEKRGHSLDSCYAGDLVLFSEGDQFVPSVKGKDLSSYDLICLYVTRRRWEWYVAARYLKDKYGTKVINNYAVDPDAFSYPTPAASYLKQSENNLPYPKSAVLYSFKEFETVEDNFSYPLVVKPAWGSKGKGVELVNSREELEKAAENAINTNPSYPACVVREFIPNDGDIRVFTVGYRAVGAMKRTPREGDFRSNISQGGSGEAFDLLQNTKIREIAEDLSRIMRVEIAGVDIILHKETGEPYILEINADPQFEGFEKYAGVNAALEIVKYFEEVSVEK